MCYTQTFVFMLVIEYFSDSFMRYKKIGKLKDTYDLFKQQQKHCFITKRIWCCFLMKKLWHSCVCKSNRLIIGNQNLITYDLCINIYLNILYMPKLNWLKKLKKKTFTWMYINRSKKNGIYVKIPINEWISNNYSAITLIRRDSFGSKK